MSSNTKPTSRSFDDSQFVPWWNPFHWPAGIWVLVVGLLLMTMPFAIRTAMLMGVPDIPEPFDGAAFSKWDVPASEDAFTDYRKAAALRLQLSIDLHAQGITDAREPDDCLALLDAGWDEATDSTKKWVERHQEALAHWRRGTEKDQGLNESPSKLTFSTLLSVVQDQRLFARLAIMEETRAIAEGRFDDARQWARAAFRSGGHTSHRGPMIQGMVAASMHAMASAGLARWAQQPEVTSEQLRQALADARSDYRLYESPSNVLKTDYLAARNSFQAPNWGQMLAPIDPNSPSTVVTGKAMRLGYWVIGEPELTLRILRQILANQLPEIDKPVAQRRKLVGAGTAMLFDPDPAVPRAPGQLDPAGIDRAIKRSSLARMLLPAMKHVDDAMIRQSARQTTLETLLSIQIYRRDHGELPEKLSDLVPTYLTTIPVDPCSRSGGPLLYRRDEPAKAVIWSVGEDGSDDGGALESPNAKSPDVGFAIK